MGVLGLYRSQIPRMAAALAYRTIFSIIPVMAIGLLIFGSVVSDEQVESGVRRVLTFAGISQIATVDTGSLENAGERTVVDPVEDPTGVEELEEVLVDPSAIAENTEEVIETLSQTDIFANADLEQVITDLITRVNSSIRNVPTGWIALTSGLVLFYAAMSMLIEIEKAFNQLCGAPSGRGWLRRLMLYWTILTAGSLLLAATFLAGDAFTRWVVGIAGQDSMIGAMMAGYGVSVLISTLLLLGAYLTIPNTKVQFRSALAGAFFAAVLWELGKLGFTTYLRYTTGYAKFYGSIAILPLFMLWVYLTWLIVLLGMQASYTLEHFSRLVDSRIRSMTDSNRRKSILVDPMVMFHVAKSVQDGFRSGKPCTGEQVANDAKLEHTQAIELLDSLTDSGVINRVYQGEEHIGWSPSRPAEDIGLAEILEAAHRVDGYRASGIDGQLPTKLKGALDEVCEGMTLADLESRKADKKGMS